MKAQQGKLDSIRNTLRGPVHDSSKFDLLIDLSWGIRLADPDSAIYVVLQAQQLLPISSKGKEWNEIAAGRCYHQLGEFYWRKSSLTEALDYSLKALAIWEKLERNASGKKNESIKYRISSTLGNIGNIYSTERNYAKALEYSFAALNTDKELNNKDGVARHTGNIGLIYFYSGDNNKALDFYMQSLEFSRELNNKTLLASALGNIGNIYYSTAEYDKALDYYGQAIEFNRATGDKGSVAINLGNMGILLLQQKKYAAAIEQMKEALAASTEVGDKEGCREMEYYLSLADSSTGNFKSAYEHYKRYVIYRDSISNEENIRKQTQLEMQYEFDKKEAEAKSAQIKKDALFVEEKRKQQVILWSVIAGLVMVFVFAVIIYISFRQKEKANIEISRQKEIIEEKQKEILDSIHYAKRIQQSLLPRDAYISRILKALMRKE